MAPGIVPGSLDWLGGCLSVRVGLARATYRKL
jgi:hypothetical protein